MLTFGVVTLGVRTHNWKSQIAYYNQFRLRGGSVEGFAWTRYHLIIDFQFVFALSVPIEMPPGGRSTLSNFY